MEPHVSRRYLTTPLVCEDCGTPAHSSISGGRQGHTMLCDGCREKRGKTPRKTAAEFDPALATDTCVFCRQPVMWDDDTEMYLGRTSWMWCPARDGMEPHDVDEFGGDGLNVEAAAETEAAADLAHAIHQEAAAVEPRVSSDMRSFADEQGGQLEGFRHRLKTEESIARKLTLKNRTRISDALRYTIVLPEDVYSLQVQSIIDSLKRKGYKEVSVENYWVPGDDYQGINSNWVVPNSDIVMELQFHTSHSLRMKEEVIHGLYERYRTMPDSDVGKQMLFNVMKKYWDFVKTPPGAANVGTPTTHTPPSNKPVSEWAEINTVTMPQWLRAARLMCMGVERGMQKNAAVETEAKTASSELVIRQFNAGGRGYWVGLRLPENRDPDDFTMEEVTRRYGTKRGLEAAIANGTAWLSGKTARKTGPSATKLMYKGVPVVMSKSNMVDYLTSLSNGARRAAADVLMEAMSNGALNKIEWISETSGGTKSWWAETWDQAWPYTFPQGMHFGKGVGVVPVIMTAEQTPSSEVVDEHWYDMGVGKAFKVDESTELRVVKVEAFTPPPKTAAALASRFRSGYKNAEWFFDAAEYAKKLSEPSHDMCYLYMSPLPIPVMVTTSSAKGYTQDAYALWSKDILPKLNKMGASWSDRVIQMLRHCTRVGSQAGDPVYAGLRVVSVGADFPLRGAIVVQREDGAKFKLFLDSTGGASTFRTQRMGSLVTGARKALPLLDRDELSAQGIHVASEDYPEMGDILWERPDLIEAEPVGASSTLMSLTSSRADRPMSVTPVSIRREAVTPKELRQQTGDPTRSGRVPPSKRTPQWKDGNPTPNYQTAQDIIDDPRSPWWWRKLIGPSVERYERARGLSYDLANTPSMDWCRFRRDSQCYYPKQLDEQATAQAGYPVWLPENRGNCWRIAWKDQKVCPMAEPGPNSREQVVYPDATVSWQDGGQRIPNGARRMSTLHQAYDDDLGDCYESAGKFMLHDVKDGADQFRLVHGLVTGQGPSVEGVRFGHAWVEYTTESGQVMVIDNSNGVGYYGKRSEYYSVGKIKESELIRYTRPEAMKMMAKFRHWGPWDKMFDKYASLSKTSAWRDVQAKAARIRANGGVHIIAVTPTSISAEVKGDSNLYLTTITRVPNSKQVALWSCGCSWNTYSWARSGRWKKYEGRMCSHALAVVYQAQSEQMFGGEVGEQRGKPTWRTSEPVSESRERPGEWRLDVAAALHDHLALLEDRRADILDDGLLTLSQQAEQVAQISRSAACVRTDLDAVRHSGLLVPGGLVDVESLGSADTLIAVPPFSVDYGGRIAEVVAIDPVAHSCMFSDGEMADVSACTHPSYDPVLGLSAPAGMSSLGAANTTGVMIALAPDLSLAEQMAEATQRAGFNAEEAQQLHISLAVLNGDTSTIDRERLMAAARSIAAQVTPMSGEIAGFGTFANGKSNVLWASVDVPGIEQLKVAVDGVLATAGLDAMSNHGFTPHLTLAYSDDPITTLPTAEDFAGQPLSFTTLVAAYGGEWVHLDLVGNSGEVVAVEKVAALYADDVDYGRQTVLNASPTQARGDWGYYSREQALRDSGMPGGQVFASEEAAQRYANMVLRDYGISEPVTVNEAPGARGEGMSRWSKDGSRGQVLLSPDLMREDFLLHELAHLIFRKGKGGKGAASHGGGYASVHAELLHRYMGLGLRLFAAKGNGIDTCKYCGSSALWGAHFDADGFYDYDERAEWDTLCEDCGKFQKRRNPRKPRTATVGQREDLSTPIQWGDEEVFSITKVDPSKIIDSFTANNGDNLIVWDSGRRKLILDTDLGTINQTFRGVLTWYPNGEIAMVSINPAYRREGIATRLFNLAKQIEPRLHHSDTLTEDGKAWSATVSSLQDDVAWLQANGGIAVLNDEPEPALPATEATPVDDMAATDSVSIPTDENTPLDSVDGLVLNSSRPDPLSPGGDALAWLMKGSSSGSGDIAAAAQQFLAKTALKDFSPVEQAEIIAEGESGVRAANLDLLQIEGTHYQALEETTVDDDASFLW